MAKLEIAVKEFASSAIAPSDLMRMDTPALQERRMLPENGQAIVPFSPAEKPRLLVIVDAEEEFDWDKPFSAGETRVATMRQQQVAQRIFEPYRLVPTYALDYVVADRADGYKPILEFLRDGTCEIGAQLHPWVTPPVVEELSERNSYPGNLPEELEYRKLAILTERIEENLGRRPRLYRAGRYGTGPNTARILKRLGYEIDCSVLPNGRSDSPYAPDYSGAPMRPYWIGASRALLEIPVTRSTIGALHGAERSLAGFVFSATGRAFRIPAVMARLRLLDRIPLTPEGTTIAEAKRLTAALLAQDQRVFVVTYHTPSLGIGHTPYVRTRAELKKFLAWLEAYLEFFFGEVGGIAATPGQILELARSGKN